MPDIRLPITESTALAPDNAPTDPTEPGSADPQTGADLTPTEPQPDTFPRDYVERLRKESAGYRERAGRADELGTRLLDATVRAHATALADPTDLMTFGTADALMGEDGFPDPGKVTAAAEALATARPHLATRRVTGDAGQGPRGTVPKPAPDLAAILRQRAG